MEAKSIREALGEALREEMQRDERVFLLGEDIGEFGGAYQVTEGLIDIFGAERVQDTPISETAILGAAIGAAITGMRPVVEIQFNDFLTCAMDQIVNHAAKMRLFSGGQLRVPLVIRSPVGATGRAAQHSQSLEAWFMHVPGLKIVVPSTPYDAKGLLKTAVRDNDPVMIFEHKLLYGGRSAGGQSKTFSDSRIATMTPAPAKEYLIPLGSAEVKREGKHITVVATLLMVHKTLWVAHRLEKEGISVEVIDPRTLVPFDKKTLLSSARKTGRVLVVSEDCRRAGVTSEIAAMIAEEAFDYLDAPIKRVAGLNVPVPFAPNLEKRVVPGEEDIAKAIRQMVV